MKFAAVVGNPPYQETTENTSDKPIYNYFMDIAFKISDKVTFITPARFLFNAGKTPKDWNLKILILILNIILMVELKMSQNGSKIIGLRGSFRVSSAPRFEPDPSGGVLGPSLAGKRPKIGQN